MLLVDSAAPCRFFSAKVEGCAAQILVTQPIIRDDQADAFAFIANQGLMDDAVVAIVDVAHTVTLAATKVREPQLPYPSCRPILESTGTNPHD